MAESAAFLKNCWHLAAWGDEVAGLPVAEIVCGVPIVLFRNANGDIRALFDRCAHRFAPLSRGRVVDGTLECGYHGMAFDGQGSCVTNPHGATIRTARVTAFPAVELHRGIWIWLGNPELADPLLVPDLRFLSDAPETAFGKGRLHANANYLLFVDNIMDLTHADYIHATSLGVGSLTRSKPEVEVGARHVRIQWTSVNEPPVPLHLSLGLFDPSDRIDTVMQVAWTPSSVLRQTTTVRRSNEDDAAPIVFDGVHVMTPETDTTLNYFHATTRNFLLADAAFNAGFNQGIAHVFATEDAPMIEAQQARIGSADLMTLKPMLMASDRGSVEVRRILDRLIARDDQVPVISAVVSARSSDPAAARGAPNDM